MFKERKKGLEISKRARLYNMTRPIFKRIKYNFRDEK